MASQLQSGFTRSKGQIMIEEEEQNPFSELSALLIQDHWSNSHINVGRGPQQIQIHKEKLLKYGVLHQKNDNKCQKSQSTKDKLNLPKPNLTPKTPTNLSSSLTTRKNINHKITSHSKPPKTINNKQNQQRFILPKMNNHNSHKLIDKTTSTQLFNKTTSAQLFKNNSILKQREGQNQQQKKRYQEPEGRMGTSKSGDLLKSRTLKKIWSKGRTIGEKKGESRSDWSMNQAEIVGALRRISSKQQNINVERSSLQARISLLKQNIDKERNLLEQIKAKNHQMCSHMNQQQHLSRYSFEGALLSKKKYQSCQTQTRQIQLKLKYITQCNLKVVQSLNEERELIGMYESVIDEVRHQLKLEKHHKIDIQKKLGVIKNTIKGLQGKEKCQQNTNRQMFRKLYASIDQWQ